MTFEPRLVCPVQCRNCRLTAVLVLVLLVVGGALPVAAQSEQPGVAVRAKLTYRMQGEADAALLADVVAVIRKRLSTVGIDGSAIETLEDGRTFTVRVPECGRADLKWTRHVIEELGWLRFAIEASGEELADPERGLGPKFDLESFYREVHDRVVERRSAEPKRCDPVTYTGEAVALYANPGDWTKPARSGDEPRFWFYPPRRWVSERRDEPCGPEYGAIVHARADMCFAGDAIEKTSPGTWGFEQVITFVMKEEAKAAFLEFTTRNVKRNLCVVWNQQLITRPVIRSALPGVGIIDGIGEPDEVRALIVALKAGKLKRRIALIHEGVIEVRAPAALSPADERADMVASALGEADRRLAAWDLQGAWSAALRAGYLVETGPAKHPLSRRAYLTLARVAIRRGGYLRSRSYFTRAARCEGGEPRDLCPIADGVAILAYRFAAPHKARLRYVLETEFYSRLSPNAAEVIDAIGPRSDPTEVAVARYVWVVRRAAYRIVHEWQEPCLALAVLGEARQVLDRHVAKVTGKRAQLASERLTRLVSKEALDLATHLFATAEQLGGETNFLGIPRNPGLAFQIGETFRVRALCETGEGSLSESGSPAGGAIPSWPGSLLDGAILTSNGITAEACYLTALRAEPDQPHAAVALATMRLRSGRTASAIRVLDALERRLLIPTRAWQGEPGLPPAPRYMVGMDVMDLVRLEGGGVDTTAAIRDFEIRAGRAQIEPYLRNGPRFHPEDTVASFHPFPDVIDNNIGFNLLRDWDLTRAAQLFRRGIYQGKQRAGDGRGPMPMLYQNLGHLYYLTGDFERSVSQYRAAADADANNVVVWNNIGALMGIFGSITLDLDLVQRGVECYERAVELAPNYVYARSSETFMRNVAINWDRYLNQKDRSSPVVWSFANSFLFAARSISEGDDPKYLQALQILDRGLRALPSDDECARIFADFDHDQSASPGLGSPRTVRERMGKVFQECFDSGRKKYASLLERHGTHNPHLNYLLAEVYRLGWRRWGRAEHRNSAVESYEETLAVAPDHVAATLALGELLQTLDREPEAIARLDCVVAELLKPWRPWDGDPAVEAKPRLADAEQVVATAAERFPETEVWRAYRARTESRIKAVAAAKSKRRKL